MSERQLGCSVSKGMFSDERAVTYRDVSVFVPREKVHEQNGHSSVDVKIFQAGKSLFAVLPSEDARIVPIEDRDLKG
ncbi:MAG TPA: hypothetical protein VFH95_00590 [Candidatus Kapabacteria bacterium]|nr:hypothetical protein [Candidatus Kapabacteria bacterium]